MAVAVYSIAQEGENWAIALNGFRAEICQTLEIAVTATVRAAALARKQGHDAQVVIDRSGTEHLLWRNGRVIEDEPGAIAA